MGRQPYSIDTILTNRPTIQDYAELPEDIREFVDSFVKDAIRPNMVLRLKKNRTRNPRHPDFWMLSWSDLILLREAVENNEIEEVFSIVYDIRGEWFLHLDVFNCFAAYKWVQEQLKNIADIEKEELGGELSPEEKNAGVEELQQFGYSASLDMLAGGDMEKYDSILLMPYAKIFRKLCLERTKGDIQKAYINNARKKVKAARK